MNNPEMLVVTPVYSTPENRRVLQLAQGRHSVKLQSYQDVVHAIVNDGSTDETPAFLQKVSRADSRVMVFEKDNGGSSSAINYGITEALKRTRPKYITVLHSDDLMPQHSLETRKNKLEQTASAMVHTDMMLFWENCERPLRRERGRRHQNPTELYEFLRHHAGEMGACQTMMWDADFFLERIGGFDPELTDGEDQDVALRTAREASRTNKRIEYADDVTIYYRLHDHNIGKRNIRDGTAWKCYKKIVRQNLQGKEYYIALARKAMLLARMVFPEPLKKPLRKLRDSLLENPTYLPFRDEFLEEMEKIKPEEYVKYLTEIASV